MISFGVLASNRAPALMKMCRPSMTKALNERSLEHHDPHVLFGQSGGAQNGLRIVAQQLFDFGIADQRHPARDAVLGARGCEDEVRPRGPNSNRAASNAIARAAGAMRRVLIGVPCKDIPIFCQIAA